MVQHIEVLARISKNQGVPELAHDLQQVAEKHRGKSPEVLKGVVVYDRSLEETVQPETIYSNNELTYDSDRCVLVVKGKEIGLTKTEHPVLWLLIQNADNVVTYNEFSRRIRDLEDDTSIRSSLRKHIHRIRRRVKDTTEKELDSIVSVYGVGYRLVDPSKRNIRDSASV